MLFRKLTCLLLSLVFVCSLAVPTVLADGTPPPGGGDIHPWDNNDDYGDNGGPILLARRPVVIIVGNGFGGQMFSVTFLVPQSWMKSRISSRDGYLRDQARINLLKAQTNNR